MAAVQQKLLVHKQFNSPLGLYSPQNIQATLDRELKAFGMNDRCNGTDNDEKVSMKPLNLANSAVLRAVEEEEEEMKCGYKRVAWPPMSEERIAREFTPQPQGQFPPSQQQSPSPQMTTRAAGVTSPNTPQQPPKQKPISPSPQQPQQQYTVAPSTQYNYQASRVQTQSYQQGVPYQQQQLQQQQLSQSQPSQQQQRSNWTHPTNPTGVLQQQGQQQQPTPLQQQQQQPQPQQQQQQQQQYPYQAPFQQPNQYQYHQQTNQFDQNHYNSYSQPLQQQQQQQLYPQDYRSDSPGIITLRKEAPISQKPAPVFTSQPAAVSFRGGSKMRGDLKWPPPEYKEQIAREEEERHQLQMGPAVRPTKIKRDYTDFFAKHRLNSYYPSYKVPPGTQHMTA